MNWGIVFLVVLGLFLAMLTAYIILRAIKRKELEEIRNKKKGEK